MRNFVVIGCGRFGSTVAKRLYELGQDVMAVDKDEELINRIHLMLQQQLSVMLQMKML